MLASSIKGTVPVLILPDGSVIDESMDIMLWALNQHDPHHWLSNDAVKRVEIHRLIEFNDTDFKIKLDHYKYADRFPAQSKETYRQKIEIFLQALNERLEKNRYLTGDDVTLADMALFPFIRQCAHVDKAWFYQTHYNNLQAWLDIFLANKLFSDVMTKIPTWQPGQSARYLPDKL